MIEELEIRAILLRKQGLIDEIIYQCLLSCAARGDLRQFEIFVKDHIKTQPNYLDATLFKYERLLRVQNVTIGGNSSKRREDM